MKKLKKLFGAGIRVEILNILLEDPKKGRYLRELCRYLDTNTNAVRREFDILEEVGLCYTETEVGKRYIFLISQKEGNNKEIDDRRQLVRDLRSVFNLLKDEN